MHLTPREIEKVLIYSLAEVALKRRAPAGTPNYFMTMYDGGTIRFFIIVMFASTAAREPASCCHHWFMIADTASSGPR